MTCVIRVGDVFCTLVQGKSGWITPALKFKDPKAFWDWRFKTGQWDGFVRMFNEDTREFPTGLLPRVLDRLTRKKRPYRLIRKARTPLDADKVEADCLHGVVLRDYQLDSVRSGIRDERGIFDLATNSGKSEIISAIAAVIVEQTGTRGLVIVPNNGLLIQTAKRIHDRTGMQVGLLGAGRATTGEVTVATIQTLSRRLGYTSDSRKKVKADPATEQLVRRAGLLCVDEAHHAVSSSYQHVLSMCPARFRFGFTGSKRGGRHKHALMEAYLGPTLKRVSNKHLMDRGVSARAFVYVVKARSMFKTPIVIPPFIKHRKRHPITGEMMTVRRELEPREKYEFEQTTLLGDATYNRKIAQIAVACVRGKFKPLVLTSSIDHLHTLEEVFKREKLRPLSVWGDVPVDERERRKEAFKEDPEGVLIGSTVFDEGQDISAIGALILASGGQSVRQLLQRLGRSFREKHEGLNAVLVIDPHPEHTKYLTRHAESRLSLYRREGFEISTVHNVTKFCEKVGDGWAALLGEEQYKKLLRGQRGSSSASE